MAVFSGNAKQWDSVEASGVSCRNNSALTTVAQCAFVFAEDLSQRVMPEKRLAGTLAVGKYWRSENMKSF